jgi:murein DD-endopeptidase MepM/ murein hydrolase activator NlpD
MPPERRNRGTRSYPQRKKRGFPLIRLTGGLILCIIIGKLLLAKRADDPTASVQQASVLPSMDISGQGRQLLESVLEPDLNSIVHIVKPGETFSSIFSLYKIANTEAALMLRGFRQLDLPTIFPGDSMLIRRGRDSSFTTLDYFSCLRNKFTVANSDSCLEVQREVLPVMTHTFLLNGRLETSLSESMFSEGVSDVITANMADIFAWDINFFIDPRKGDSFQVLFEKKLVNGRTCGYGDIIAARYTLGTDKTFYAFGLRDSSGRLRYYDANGRAVQKQFLKAPLRYSRVSSGFTYHRKHPVLGIVRPHLGVDYAAPSGTPVNAAADGKVIFAGVKSDYGKLVIVAHGGAYQTYYGHLQQFGPGIRPGKTVLQGDVVGRVGATGLATGPHLDYRMQRTGKFVNPMTISSPSLQNVPGYQEQEFAALREQCGYLFNHRFSERNGCFLVDITLPQPSAPARCKLSKIPVDAAGKTIVTENQEANGSIRHN